ncbi:MAG: aminomethyl-transferring glycine dehydrogenase subunit GcvPA [Pseudomonadota bacterium]
MPFVPHTEADVQAMLAEIGAPSIQALFDEIPAHLASGQLEHVPSGISEMALLQLMQERAAADEGYVCFMGAGSYDHHIPAAVWDLAARGEFMTAYTPYQAEASQGTLQLIYEYQSMMVALTGMDVSNASVYDGASGLAEAMLMALRGNKKNKSARVLVADTVHPHYTEASRNIVSNQGLTIERWPLAESDGGVVAPFDCAEAPAAIVIQQPNFFGRLEDVDALTDWAHSQGSLVVAVVNPLSLALLKPPGEWGERGADIVCGDGQPFGVPMASGGPSFGFICATQALVRQMPGRIIGRTEDLEGRTGYTLTLQAREQHIRRGKATSNICTNQGLLVTAGTIYLSLMGPAGLQEAAQSCHRNCNYLTEQLCQLAGISRLFDGPCFHEVAVRLPLPAAQFIQALLEEGILAGIDLGDFVPDLITQADHCLLIATTEKRTRQQMDAFVAAAARLLEA